VPYSQVSLGQLQNQLSTLLDDPSSLYWQPNELQYAIWEGLYYWGALTNYWRSRGAFSLTPNVSYYDISAQLPLLRTRTWTLNAMVNEIQYHLLESAGGLSGGGMTGQVTVQNILLAIQRARDRFVIDVHFPFSTHKITSPPSPQGTISFPQASVYVHRATWQDQFTGRWNNLWREDAWSLDKANWQWPLTPDLPATYSESELAPLTLQLVPAPLNSGTLEIISVDSLQVDITNPAATFNIPDEWIHAVKYAALWDIYSSESQVRDDFRAEYAKRRYEQSVTMAQTARSVQRLTLGGVPSPIDSFQAIDAALPYWRNQTGSPVLAGVLYDAFVVAPGLPDQAYGVSVDVIQSAPIPISPINFIPLGEEDIPALVNYCANYLSLKCGGNNLKTSFAQYDAFMKRAALRGRINAAKIRYLEPLFGQPQREEAARPDVMAEAAEGANA